MESELGKGSSFRVTIPWMVMEAGKPSSPLLTKLDDLTRPARGEFESPDATSTEAAAS